MVRWDFNRLPEGSTAFAPRKRYEEVNASKKPAASLRRPKRRKKVSPLDNAAIAELLGQQSQEAKGHLQQAFRRAARNAFLWPEEAGDLAATGRPLTELAGVGPFLAKQIQQWIDAPPALSAPPELRADFLTMAQARKILAENPDWPALLGGDLQMHTTWSDGSGTIMQMAEAGAARQYRFIAITDHTKGLKIAGGIDEGALADQGREIAAVNAQLAARGSSLTVLRSTEVNLSLSGQVDMEATALQQLDLVLGSFHSALRKSEDQTARYLAALRNPHLHILGHPQGRVYNYRLGLQADWSRVFAEAARLDKAVEIDGYPDRQDLKLSLLRIAREEGARISFGTDAHHPWQLAFIDLSLAAAFSARIPVERIINFLPLEKLRRWAAAVRERGKAAAERLS